ncbi:MAG: hypothetical protein ACOCQR_02410 [bacterium]
MSSKNYEHAWRVHPEHTTSEAEKIYHCSKCGLYDPCPLAPQNEDRECKKNKYKDDFVVDRWGRVQEKY